MMIFVCSVHTFHSDPPNPFRTHHTTCTWGTEWCEELRRAFDLPTFVCSVHRIQWAKEGPFQTHRMIYSEEKVLMASVGQEVPQVGRRERPRGECSERTFH